MIDRRTLLLTSAMSWLLTKQGRAQTPPPRHAQLPVRGSADPVETIDLWSDGALNRTGAPLIETVNERSTDPGYSDRAVYGISRPRMAVFRPQRPNGVAAMITPGGGYRWVVIDKEGYELARWLSARGYTCFVLFYRLPGEGWAEGPDTPLADAQRAIRLIRQRSGEFGIDPARIAAIGFSAGGHVCADLAARFANGARPPLDAIDRLSARPDAAAPIYPVVSMDPAIAHAGSRALLLGAQPTAALEAAHSPDRNVPADAPPHFLLHAEDDGVVPVENSLRLRASLLTRGIAVETHLFQRGGHGFGLRQANGLPVAAWPELLYRWLQMTLSGS
jgi:acetyl esterase/lipase